MTTTKSRSSTTLSVNHSERQALIGSDRLPLSDIDQEEQAENGNINSIKLLLARIVELQELRLRRSGEEREKSDVNDKIKHDWMLAAAVIDRIFFIIVNFLFFGGTFVFFVLFFSITP